jgi:paraquat-inducible protein A
VTQHVNSEHAGTPPNLAICHECGLLVHIRVLFEGQKAACPRCRYVITRTHANAINRILAFSFTALILLVLSTQFSFIELNAQGQVRAITLADTVKELLSLGEWALGLFILVVIVGIPSVFILSLMCLALSIKFGQVSHRSIWLLRIIATLRFWNMAEIFFLGILISMIKVVSLADITLGPSFWTYALFSLFLIATLLHVDHYRLGQTIRQLVEQRQLKTERSVHE